MSVTAEKLYRIEYELDERKMCFCNLEDGTPHQELLRGDWISDRMLCANWAMGKRDPGDIVVGQSTAWFYLSERLQRLCQVHQLTGWTTQPILLHNKAGDICPGYGVLSITGRCGPQDRRKGEVVPGQKLGKNYVQHRGMYFDESTWDGSDFFLSNEGGSFVFATDRVKNLFDKYKIEGFEFTPLTEATWYKKSGE